MANSPKYSIVIPVYNRPKEVEELLVSLVEQTYKDFEVLIIEDGSSDKCEDIVQEFQDRLNISYYFKENSGQGFSRNYGYERAKGEYFLVFDSDCILPPEYMMKLDQSLKENPLDAFGGPDSAHESFTKIQKAISYAMTSIFTTGGIRGGKKHLGKFEPRSFNMGISREVFEKTGGYILPKKGEDIEFSLRILQQGFRTGLIPEAYVYHKRRTNFRQFFKQLHFFGTARINVGRFFPSQVKIVHFFPLVFTLGLLLSVLLLFLIPILGIIGVSLYSFYFFLLFIDALRKTKNISIAFLGVIAGFIQLTAYGLGFLQEGLVYLRKG